MRCPKCGYNSFDYLDSCKKCGKDLAEFKQRYGIQSILFPGKMSPTAPSEEPEFESASADAAVAAATGMAVASAAALPAEPEAAEPLEKSSTEADDFGFDFMGDSAEDDDLSFDELFEEAPEDEDIEESIEGPKSSAPDPGGDEEEDGGDDFAFELPEEDGLADEFGIDEEPDTVSFDDDPEPPEEETGIGEDPKSPFDLPESSAVLGAPDSQSVFSFAAPQAGGVVQPDDNDRNDCADQGGLDAYYSSAFDEEPEPVDADRSGESAAEDPAAQLPAAAIAESVPESAGFPQPEQPAAEDLSVVEPSALRVDEEALYQEYYRGFDGDQSPPAATDLSSASLTDLSVSAAHLEASEAEFFGDDFEKSAGLSATGVPPTLSRVLASLFDDLILIIVGGCFVVAAEYAMGGANAYLPSLDTLLDLSIPYFLVLFFLCFGYFTLFYFLVGQTPGKMLMGLRVESAGGNPLTFGQAFLRSVGGLLQLVPAGLGLIALLFNREKRGWNDLLAGTRVVSIRQSPEGTQDDSL